MEKQTYPNDITTRVLALRLDAAGVPVTLDDKNRSVEVVCATEAPVQVVDWERWEIVDEVLLMSGCEFPEPSRQVPLLNTHKRGDISQVLGSCRALEITGNQLVGRAHYSEADELSEQAYQKTREGHLTDYSVGYRIIEVFYVPEDEKQIIDGRTFEGPVRVVTKWKVRELSTCPIGADEFAKARADVASHERQTIQQEENVMNKKLRTFLEGRGLKTTATEEEAWRFLDKMEIRKDGKLPADLTDADLKREEPAAVNLTEDDVHRQAQQIASAEINRREEIRSMCDHYGLGDMARELISGNKSLDEARQAVMAKHMESSPVAGGAGFRAEVGTDERDKFRSAAEDSLILRTGSLIEKPAAGADDLRGFSLRELARESLRMSGMQIGGDALKMIGRALSSDDFSSILANVANKSLMEGYETAQETWQAWCGTGSVSDFKTNTIARASETDDLDEIGENDEFKYGDLSDGKEQFSIATYGKLLKIGRQTIINDDLDALSSIPMKHGEAWSRKIGDIAYAVLTANSAMGDAIALFHASHGNLGTGGAISETTLAEMIKLMKLQKDIGGKRRLNISPQFLIAPVALEGSAEIFFGSQLLDVSSGSAQANPYAGSRFKRVYDARLDDDSSNAWYLAGPQGKTVKVFFLNGNQAPYLEARQGWSVDGVEFKVRGDAGAKAVDWKALGKNAGS